MDNNIGLKVFQRLKKSYLNIFKLGYIRKFRPKRFHKIGSRSPAQVRVSLYVYGKLVKKETRFKILKHY
jgi:hypothetical protein